MTKCYRLMLGDRVLPIDMHAVAADERGDIIRLDRVEPIAFVFTYRGLPVAGRITMTGEADAHLRLTAEIATPSSDRLRDELAAIADSAGRRLKHPLRLDGGTLLLAAEVRLAGALTAVNLVAGIAGCLAPASPYFDLVQERMAEASRGSAAD